eukprot:8814358-Pyramimonas_sp.AAC.1
MPRRRTWSAAEGSAPRSRGWAAEGPSGRPPCERREGRGGLVGEGLVSKAMARGSRPAAVDTGER